MLKKILGHTLQVIGSFSGRKKKRHGDSGNKERGGVQEAPHKTALGRNSEASTSQDKTAYGEKARENTIQKFPGFRSYFREMFLNEKAGFWTAVFTAVLTVFTLLLVCVTNKVDETTRKTQR